MMSSCNVGIFQGYMSELMGQAFGVPHGWLAALSPALLSDGQCVSEAQQLKTNELWV